MKIKTQTFSDGDSMDAPPPESYTVARKVLLFREKVEKKRGDDQILEFHFENSHKGVRKFSHQ